MRIDRDSAAVITDSDPVADAKLDLDAGGMAGDRLVHCIVEDFGHEMMEPALVGAADIHAGAAANRLQPFQNLDVLGGIAVVGFRGRRIEEIRHGANIRRAGVPASRIRYGVLLSPQDIGQSFDGSSCLTELFGPILSGPLGGATEGTLAELADLRL